MDQSKKKTLIIAGIIETIILIFCLVVSIVVWVTFVSPDSSPTYVADNLSKNGAFIGTLQNNHVLFFCCIVLPLFVIFLVDAIYLIFYATKKESAIGDKERESIEEEARKQAREELLAEMKAGSKAPVEAEAKKAEDPKK